MRTLILSCVLAMMAACDGGGGGGSDGNKNTGPVRLESSSLQSGDFDSCDVVGTVFNDSTSRTCDVFLQFGAFDGNGTLIGDGNDFPHGIPPRTRANYAATILGNGDFVSCSQIASFRLTDSSVFCD
jgi:hypothetical protein